MKTIIITILGILYVLMELTLIITLSCIFGWKGFAITFIGLTSIRTTIYVAEYVIGRIADRKYRKTFQ